MTDLPVERFWLGRGREKSYYNSRQKTYEDLVVEEENVRKYLLIGNEIATLINERILRLDTAGWDTLTTQSRLYEIVYWGNAYGFRVPLTPRLRATGAIYWQDENGNYVVPIRYPIEIDVKTGEVITPLLRVIPTWVISPSRSNRKDGIVKRRNGGYYVFKNGQQYLLIDGVLYQLNEKKGFWIEEIRHAKIVEFI